MTEIEALVCDEEGNCRPCRVLKTGSGKFRTLNDHRLMRYAKTKVAGWLGSDVIKRAVVYRPANGASWEILIPEDAET